MHLYYCSTSVLSTDNEIDRLKVYEEYQRRYPNAEAPKRLPLNFTTGRYLPYSAEYGTAKDVFFSKPPVTAYTPWYNEYKLRCHSYRPEERDFVHTFGVFPGMKKSVFCLSSFLFCSALFATLSCSFLHRFFPKFLIFCILNDFSHYWFVFKYGFYDLFRSLHLRNFFHHPCIRHFFISGDRFKSLMDSYLRKALRKGVPSLFVNVRGLYEDKMRVSVTFSL